MPACATPYAALPGVSVCREPGQMFYVCGLAAAVANACVAATWLSRALLDIT